MEPAWIGLTACVGVIYYGIIHHTSNPMILLNPHALILVIGGTFAIGFLTYSPSRLFQVFEFILMGFLFRAKKKELVIAQDLLAFVALHFRTSKNVYVSEKPYPFLEDAFHLLDQTDVSEDDLLERLTAQRNSIKRRYSEDAKILNNLAKYPPHLGLLGAASGMIEMMSALGSAGTAAIGASMATALSATLWGVGVNNFVFLPLADNATKAADDEIYLRDLIIAVVDKIKKGGTSNEAIDFCLDRLSLLDRVKLLGSIDREQINADVKGLRRAG